MKYTEVEYRLNDEAIARLNKIYNDVLTKRDEIIQIAKDVGIQNIKQYQDDLSKLDNYIQSFRKAIDTGLAKPNKDVLVKLQTLEDTFIDIRKVIDAAVENERLVMREQQ